MTLESPPSVGWDKWYPRMWRLGLTLMGGAMFFHETYQTSQAQPWLLVTGLGLCGIPVTTFLDKLSAK